MSKPVHEKRFDYKGFPCVVLLMPMAYRCGYVGIPKGHKYYGKNYDYIPIDCHCGLTYSEKYLYGQLDENTWWIGFDCGHYCDGYDVEAAKKLYADDRQAMTQITLLEQTGYYQVCNEDNPIRTLDYCIEQCKRIVDQLISEVGK
jgi:hypothetical protein